MSVSPQQIIQKVLAQLPLFSGESPMLLEWLSGQAFERYIEEGEVLLEAGCDNHNLYLILEGTLRIELDAEDRPVSFPIHRGDCVGELSVLDGKPTTARVVAAQRSHLFIIGRETMWELLDNSPVMARNMLSLLTHRIRKNNAALSNSFILQRRYAHNARVDPLTGLYNRYWLDEMLPRFIERARLGDKALGLLMLDVDHFKRFNDRYGHLAGDEVLRELGGVIGKHLRSDDSAIRYGGEEFVIVLPGLPQVEVIQVAERLCRQVKRQTALQLEDKGLPGVTVSIGVAMLAPGQDGLSLIAEADEALYRAKGQGRNRVLS